MVTGGGWRETDGGRRRVPNLVETQSFRAKTQILKDHPAPDCLCMAYQINLVILRWRSAALLYVLVVLLEWRRLHGKLLRLLSLTWPKHSNV